MGTRGALIYTAIVLVTLTGFYAARNITIETDLTGYSLATAASLKAYEDMQANFALPGPSESVVIIENQEGWRSYQAFKRLHELIVFWERQAGVDRVSGITNVVYPRQSLMTVRRMPFLNLKDEASFNSRYRDWQNYADITRKFISADQHYAVLFIATKSGSGLDQKAIEAFIDQVSSVPGLAAHFLQNDLVEKEIQRITRKDSVQLAVISTLLILAAFYLLTKSLRGLLLIVLMVAFNLACTLMFIRALNIPFTIHMITVPCIVIVLSFTDIMHILYHQKITTAEGLPGGMVRRKVIKAVQRPIWVTSLTNVIGFFIFLLLSENVYLFNFALVSIAGVAVAFLSSRFLVLYAISAERPLIRRSGFTGLNTTYGRLLEMVQAHLKMVYATLCILFVLVTLVVINFFKIDSSEGKFMSDESPLTRANTILNEAFFGDKQAEVIIYLGEHELWSDDVLAVIDSLEKDIQRLFAPAYLESPALLVRRYRRFQRNGHPRAFTLPYQVTKGFEQDLDDFADNLGGGAILSEDRKVAKIAFGYRNSGLEESRRQYDELVRILNGYEKNGLGFELTGRSFLGDQGAYSFTIKIITGLLAGMVVASLLTMMVVRSARKSLGLIFVNLFPVAVVTSLMLLSGIAITPLTLFFLSLLAGLCVDDSIYIVMQTARGKEELHVFPIIVTSAVLGVGFMALGFSNFEWIRPFAWVFLAGILLALVMDLLILPAWMNSGKKKD